MDKMQLEIAAEVLTLGFGVVKAAAGLPLKERVQNDFGQLGRNMLENHPGPLLRAK